MSWGTNEKGTNEMGDQWEGGPVSGSQTYHSMDFDNFNSAVDIVSGAFPMPSCPSSVHRSSVVSNLYFKSNMHPSFHPMFPIFVLNVYNNIALIKPAELEFLFLAFIFFMDF